MNESSSDSSSDDVLHDISSSPSSSVRLMKLVFWLRVRTGGLGSLPSSFASASERFTRRYLVETVLGVRARVGTDGRLARGAGKGEGRKRGESGRALR